MMHKLSIVGVSGNLGSGKDTVADYLCKEYGFVKMALADPIKRFGHTVFGFTEEQLWGPSASRNAVDLRYNNEARWDKALIALEATGHQYITDLVGTTDLEMNYQSLVHWFCWLRASYTGKLSPRIMLQALGTEWGRDVIGNDVWMNALLRDAKRLLHEDGDTKCHTYHPLHGITDVTKKILPLGVTVSDIRFENEFKRIRETGGIVMRVLRPETDGDAASVGIVGHASEQEHSVDNFDFIIQNDKSLTELFQSVDAYMPIYMATHH